ncbi:VPLPA-CTERM sorting domain-containing protein [Poseidonocella sedimentorum]|uniref:VPLPA-CTERM protein sorting domain-containing protein n=1 Tax=Poseidonocella sedimentorum TaxID=871652 RepID=A0A1I6DY01_9RHOB|nr:VPLPA-CTERM sorting domain-containing protein [Poseidonocella sedimentorum]SFR10212.1 VPLPA-CTERM protein sorting domain-containing protein [Poseidonocella sedimentorum]
MIRNTLLAVASVLGLASASQAATIDLDALGLETGAVIGSSSTMAIVDIPPFLSPGTPPIVLVPGFFQALDATGSPVLELNTGDGLLYNLVVSPGFTEATTETAREGDRQLELLFGTSIFARLVLADGDSLDNMLTGADFSDASLTVWELETAVIPLPAGMPLLLAGLGGLAALRLRKAAR